jgi:hypothetical protein
MQAAQPTVTARALRHQTIVFSALRLNEDRFKRYNSGGLTNDANLSLEHSMSF